MTYAECIEARRLLGMTQTQLATAAKLSQTIISTFESTGHMARPKGGARDRAAYLKVFFEKAGVEFTRDVPTGVRMRKAEA